MRILVTAATIFEIDDFVRQNKNSEVLITGIGAPAAIYHLTRQLSEKAYDLVIQAGIAGSFLKEIKRTEVVIVATDTFADIGVEEKGEYKTMFDTGLADGNDFPFTDGWLINPNDFLRSTNLKTVKGITINKLSDKKKQTLDWIKNFDAEIETMEGAALHYVCLQMNIPFLQLRSISNKVGERNKNKWKMKEAIENLNIELIKLVETFYKK